MAVDEDDDVIVHNTTVKFDGDWAKAAAIDAALTYGIFAVDRFALAVKSQVASKTPLDAKDFTWITAIFEEVLRQRGYVVCSAKDAELFEEGVEHLTDRIDLLVHLNNRKDENLDKQSEEITELQEKNLQLHEGLAEAEAEIVQLRQQLAVSYDPDEAGDTFNASKCGGLNPYRASNGAPCISVWQGTTLPGVLNQEKTLHQDETGFRWSADNGVSEEVARRLQADYAAQTDELAEFKKSACDGLNPYRSTDGIPCLLRGVTHGGGPHWSRNKDGVGYSWYDHEGVDEKTARGLQQQASKPQ